MKRPFAWPSIASISTATPGFARSFFTPDCWLRSKTWLDGFICGALKWILERRWGKYPQPSGKLAPISDRHGFISPASHAPHALIPAHRNRNRNPRSSTAGSRRCTWPTCRGKIHSSNSTPTVAEVKQGRAEAIRQIKAAPDDALAVIEQVTNATALHSDEAP